MLYVAILHWKDGIPAEKMQEAQQRRAQWQYPASVKLIGEYWPLAAGAPTVVSVFEAQDAAPVFETVLTWQDIFDIDVYPAVTAEEGIRLAMQMAQAQAGR